MNKAETPETKRANKAEADLARLADQRLHSGFETDAVVVLALNIGKTVRDKIIASKRKQNK